jgi:chromosome segregation ATPase
MRTMTGTDVRERATRWLAESGGNRQALAVVLNEFGRLQDIAFTAEKEIDRLRVSMEAAEAETRRLREGVARMRGENARCMKEREDIAAALSQFMGEVLSKLRGRPEWSAASIAPPKP